VLSSGRVVPSSKSEAGGVSRRSRKSGAKRDSPSVAPHQLFEIETARSWKVTCHCLFTTEMLSNQLRLSFVFQYPGDLICSCYITNQTGGAALRILLVTSQRGILAKEHFS
jgi:hypothetical protein